MLLWAITGLHLTELETVNTQVLGLSLAEGDVTTGQLPQAHTVVCIKESKEQRHKLHLCAVKTKDLTFELSRQTGFSLQCLTKKCLCLKKIQTNRN